MWDSRCNKVIKSHLITLLWLTKEKAIEETARTIGKVPMIKFRAIPNMKHSDCLANSIAIMKYTGVWMPDNLKRPFLYKLFGFSVQFWMYLCTVAAELAYIFTVFGDTERTVDAAVLLLSHIVQGVKILTICSQQGRIKRLIQYIDGPYFQKTDPTKKAIQAKMVRVATIAGQIIITSAGITGMFWCIVPVLKSELSLPLKTAYPFNISGYPMFPIMYAYTSISVVVVGVGDAAENYLVSGLLILAATQLDVLSAELLEIDAQDKKTNYRDTVTSIKYHQNIIEFVDELASIFGLTIFCQFLTTSIIVCMTLFKITITTELIELTTLIFYLICVFLELLMYCYPGDLLINKSLLVAEAANPGHWWGDLQSRKALILCAMRAQRALLINAGGVFRASLPTAAAVVRTAYSYYAVLQQKMND